MKHNLWTFICSRIGRRCCPGENVAKQALTVLLATMMQNLSVRLPDGEARPQIIRSNGTGEF